jgi:hypothetical protein
VNLPRDGVKLNTNIKAADFAKIERKEIEENRSIPVRINGNHSPADVFLSLLVDVQKIGRLSAETAPVVYNLALDLIFAEIDERHESVYPSV